MKLAYHCRVVEMCMNYRPMLVGTYRGMLVPCSLVQMEQRHLDEGQRKGEHSRGGY